LRIPGGSRGFIVKPNMGTHDYDLRLNRRRDGGCPLKFMEKKFCGIRLMPDGALGQRNEPVIVSCRNENGRMDVLHG
jgi:hypothetical protein